MEHKRLHACTPENCSQVESFHRDPLGKSHFWFDRNGPRNREREKRHGAALSPLQSRVKVFLDPHQIPDTLNWIFNQGAEPMIKFLLSVALEIYQKSAAMSQYQKHAWWNCGFWCPSVLPEPIILTPSPKMNAGKLNIKTLGTHKIWQMCFNIRGKTCVFSYSQLVRCQGPNKLVLWPLGSMCAACDALPCTEESESNLKHWISVMHLTNFLLSIHGRSERFSVTRIISQIPEGKDNWQLLRVKTMFFLCLLAICKVRDDANL